MKKYLIENLGCDDYTKFEIKLSNYELKTILKFIKLNNKNVTYICQPSIQIYDNYFYDCNGIPLSTAYINGKLVEAHNLLLDNEKL